MQNIENVPFCDFFIQINFGTSGSLAETKEEPNPILFVFSQSASLPWVN